MNESRREPIQRLNTKPRTLQQMEDDEQADYIQKWLAEHPNNGNFGAWACIIVIAMAASLAIVNTALRADVPAQPAIVQTYLRADFCMTCHFPRGDKATKPKHRKHPALSQKRLLDDFKAAL